MKSWHTCDAHNITYTCPKCRKDPEHDAMEWVCEAARLLCHPNLALDPERDEAHAARLDRLVESLADLDRARGKGEG